MSERMVMIPASLVERIDVVLSDAACGIEGGAGRQMWGTERIMVQTALMEALRKRPTATRNLVGPETAEANRTLTGRRTFNAMPPVDYDGLMMVFACVRLGEHAHVEVQSGRWLGTSPSHKGELSGSCLVGLAGRMVLRWHEWVAFRDTLDTQTPYRIAEVECPTQAQLDRYVTVAPPDVGAEVFS